MSEHVHHPAESHAAHDPSHAPAKPSPDFDKAELKFFDRDDVHAGGSIGKMLAVIFVYTLIATAIVGWWTFRAVFH
jgi:hypothetical protein